MKGRAHLRALLGAIKPVTDRLVEQGAEVVWLAGSHVRGEATPHSDVDLGVIAAGGAGPGYRLQRQGNLLLSISWTTAAATLRSFGDPAVLGAAVPGWRQAVLVYDPSGTGEKLRAAALDFTWTAVYQHCDRWVAEQVTGYAEEVHKLANAITRRDPLSTAVQRNVLATRLAFVLSVHRRILYDSENVLWPLVAGSMGEPWSSEQAAALATAGESLEASSKAALRLYCIAAAEAGPLLDRRQRDVVDGALRLAVELADAKLSARPALPR